MRGPSTQYRRTRDRQAQGGSGPTVTNRATVNADIKQGRQLITDKKFSTAQALFQRIIIAARELVGQRHTMVADCLAGLATCLEKTRKYKDALNHWDQAHTIYMTSSSASNLNAIKCVEGKARCHAALCQYTESLSLWREAEQHNLKARGAEHPSTLFCVEEEAACLMSLSRAGEALPLWRRSKEARAATNPGAPRNVYCLEQEAKCLQRMGDFGAALLLWEQAAAQHERERGPGHQFTRNCREHAVFCRSQLAGK